MLQENWQKVHVPDTSMQWSLPVVGPLTLTLSDIELHDLRFDGSKTGLITSDQGTFVLTVEGEVITVSQLSRGSTFGRQSGPAPAVTCSLRHAQLSSQLDGSLPVIITACHELE